MIVQTLKEALQRIEELERENERLCSEIEMYKRKSSGGRKKHDAAWMASYNNFAEKYKKGMKIKEIVEEGTISRRTAYRYKAYYDELQKMH